MASMMRKIMYMVLLLSIVQVCFCNTSFAYSEREYSISSYDVNVRVNTDGSLDVTESVKYTSFGGYNNTLLIIDKQENEEIEVQSVYMLKKNGYIECEQLSAGQWQANLFSGTYSVIQEKDLVRLKVYGGFNNRYGTIITKYKVKNAIKRYNDIAEYKRVHIQKSWEGRVSNINISVSLPVYSETDLIKPYLHGVLVGKKKVESRRSITFNIPNTVPGEYVETRIIFPQSVVYNASTTDSSNYLDTVIEQEDEYDESDKADLLKARENAAKEAGRRAMSERIKQRTKLISSILSILASMVGLYTLIKIHKKFNSVKVNTDTIIVKNVDEMTPDYVRVLMSNGKTGARAFMGSLLNLASRGYLNLGVEKNEKGKEVIFFETTDKDRECLSNSEQFLLSFISELKDGSRSLKPFDLLSMINSSVYAKNTKKLYDQWENSILEDYANKHKIDKKIIFYRNIGLLFGSLLFFLGCVVSVTLSIWAGYSMLPVGLVLLYYSLRKRKHNDYGILHYSGWKEIKKHLLKDETSLEDLPVWMKNSLALLGFSVALGAEKQLKLVKLSDLKEDCGCLNKIIDLDNNNKLETVVRNTLEVLDSALSSVQDAV